MSRNPRPLLFQFREQGILHKTNRAVLSLYLVIPVILQNGRNEHHKRYPVTLVSFLSSFKITPSVFSEVCPHCDLSYKP